MVGGRWLPLALPLVAVGCGARSGLDYPTRFDADTFDAGFDAFVPVFDATVPDAEVDADEGDAIALTDAPILIETGPPPHLLDCAEAGITYIYVIGEDNGLYSFYPSSEEFTRIGTIDCPDPESPFSMAVDHTGVAYVVFSSGYLYRVSTKDASCKRTAFVPNQHGFFNFGMGFAADTTSPTGETLYVASNSDSGGTFAGYLGSINTTTFALTIIAPLGSADGVQVYDNELTGTGSGGLYAFFTPPTGGDSTYIARLNAKTARVESLVELPNVALGEGWAFGFWGGDFYTFTAPSGSTSIVTRYNPADGSYMQVATAPANVLIVGAGVSTCAPQQ